MKRITAAVVGVASLIAGPPLAEADPGEPAVERVRPLHPRVKRLLLEGQKKSWTFARLISDLGQSDVVVYIHVRPHTERSDPQLAAGLYFMASIAGQRYLRVCLYVSEWVHESRMIATLAHELHHAVEVARADTVQNHESFTALYRRIASERRGDVFETRAAREIETTVLQELRKTTRSNQPVQATAGGGGRFP